MENNIKNVSTSCQYSPNIMNDLIIITTILALLHQSHFALVMRQLHLSCSEVDPLLV